MAAVFGRMTAVQAWHGDAWCPVTTRLQQASSAIHGIQSFAPIWSMCNDIRWKEPMTFAHVLTRTIWVSWANTNRYKSLWRVTGPLWNQSCERGLVLPTMVSSSAPSWVADVSWVWVGSNILIPLSILLFIKCEPPCLDDLRRSMSNFVVDWTPNLINPHPPMPVAMETLSQTTLFDERRWLGRAFLSWKAQYSTKTYTTVSWRMQKRQGT